MAIRGIGFDYLGVTADLPRHDRSIYAILGQLLGISAAKVELSYQSHSQGLREGAYDENELWRLVATDLGVPDQTGAIIEAATIDIPKPNSEVLDLVDRLRRNGYLVGLLSNLGSGTEWDAALYKAGVDKHFDAVVLSGDLGVAKPDPRAFEALADAMEIETNQMIFIDDRESSVSGVESIGITPIIYQGGEHGLDDLVVALKAHRIKI